MEHDLSTKKLSCTYITRCPVEERQADARKKFVSVRKASSDQLLCCVCRSMRVSVQYATETRQGHHLEGEGTLLTYAALE